jgi:hypothetical protein
MTPVSASNATPFANVFGAFSAGLSGQTGSEAQPSSSAPASGSDAAAEIDTFSLLQVLQSLEAEGGSLPFAEFAKRLPGDNFTALSSTVRLMKDGWVEFVGDISETSVVRLTPRGRDMLATLKNSIAAA